MMMINYWELGTGNWKMVKVKVRLEDNAMFFGFPNWWAENRSDGFIKNCFEAFLCQGRTLEELDGTNFFSHG